MANEKLRRLIAVEAARLMYNRHEKEYFRAKLKAARRVCTDWVKPRDLPSNREIRDQVQLLATMHEGDSRLQNLRDMRIEALRLMRMLRSFRPRLIGSTLTGHVRKGSDIDIHIFSDSLEAVVSTLDEEGYQYDVEHKRVQKYNAERIFTHIHVYDRFTFELTMYAEEMSSFPFRSSITGQPIEKAGIADLEELLAVEYPDLVVDDEIEAAAARPDRFQTYRMLLIPLQAVAQSKQYHPEGDALYHSLQVFERMRDERPYDEELLLAALLHDVGKAIDPYDHVRAALDALEGSLTERTAWLIEHHMEAHALRDGSIGARARRRLEESPDFEDLVLLGECDRAGRQWGVPVCEIEDALHYIRDLATQYG